MEDPTYEVSNVLNRVGGLVWVRILWGGHGGGLVEIEHWCLNLLKATRSLQLTPLDSLYILAHRGLQLILPRRAVFPHDLCFRIAGVKVMLGCEHIGGDNNLLIWGGADRQAWSYS